MTDSTATPADDEPVADESGAAGSDVAETDAEAPEEELLEGWLPEATPTDGPAPAP